MKPICAIDSLETFYWLHRTAHVAIISAPAVFLRRCETQVRFLVIFYAKIRRILKQKHISNPGLIEPAQTCVLQHVYLRFFACKVSKNFNTTSYLLLIIVYVIGKNSYLSVFIRQRTIYHTLVLILDCSALFCL